MKKLNIEVCACTECVMNGSMDIAESIEDLKNMSGELGDEYNTDIEIVVTSVNNLCRDKHKDCSPVVLINDKLYKNTNGQSIMAEIIALMKNEEEFN